MTAQLAALLPSRAPSPKVWRAIEARVRVAAPAPGDPASRGRRLWELADWFVVATVIGLYLYGSPVDPRRRGQPPERERSVRHCLPRGCCRTPGPPPDPSAEPSPPTRS